MEFEQIHDIPTTFYDRVLFILKNVIPHAQSVGFERCGSDSKRYNF